MTVSQRLIDDEDAGRVMSMRYWCVSGRNEETRSVTAASLLSMSTFCLTNYMTVLRNPIAMLHNHVVYCTD